MALQSNTVKDHPQASLVKIRDSFNKHPKTTVLTLNAGSYSLKFALFDVDCSLSQIASGTINGIGSTLATFTFKDMSGEVLEHAVIPALDPVRGLAYLLDRLEAMAGSSGRSNTAATAASISFSPVRKSRPATWRSRTCT